LIVVYIVTSLKMLFNTLCKIGKNFLSRFDDDSLIFIRKSFSFHASLMISFDNSNNDVKIVGERLIRNTNEIFSF